MKHFQLTFTAKKTDHLSDGVSCNIISAGTKKDEDHMLTASFTVSEDLADAINNISMAHVAAITESFNHTVTGHVASDSDVMDARPEILLYIPYESLGGLSFDERFEANDIMLQKSIEVVICLDKLKFVFYVINSPEIYHCEMPIAELKNHPI